MCQVFCLSNNELSHQALQEETQGIELQLSLWASHFLRKEVGQGKEGGGPSLLGPGLCRSSLSTRDMEPSLSCSEARAGHCWKEEEGWNKLPIIDWHYLHHGANLPSLHPKSFAS